MSTDIPRRSNLLRLRPAERAIRNAMLAVEAMPGSPLLTEAVGLLQQARDKVADHIDAQAAEKAGEAIKRTQDAVSNFADQRCVS